MNDYDYNQTEKIEKKLQKIVTANKNLQPSGRVERNQLFKKSFLRKKAESK